MGHKSSSLSFFGICNVCPPPGEYWLLVFHWYPDTNTNTDTTNTLLRSLQIPIPRFWSIPIPIPKIHTYTDTRYLYPKYIQKSIRETNIGLKIQYQYLKFYTDTWSYTDTYSDFYLIPAIFSWDQKLYWYRYHTNIIPIFWWYQLGIFHNTKT